MSWVMEQPLPIIFVGVVTVAILFGGFMQTGNKVFLWVMFGAAMLFAGLVVVEHQIVTPREEVENTIYAIARDAETNDVKQVLTHISKKNKALPGAVRFHMNLAEIEEVKIKSDLTVDVRPDQEPPTATAKFHAVVIGSDRMGNVRQQRFPRVFRAEFVFEDGVWKVYDYEMRSPVGGL